MRSFFLTVIVLLVTWTVTVSAATASATVIRDEPVSAVGSSGARTLSSTRDMSDALSSPTKTGPVRTAVLLINFPSDRSTPDITDVVRERMFTGAISANKLYQSQSGGTVSIVGKNNPDGDVYGWLATDFVPDGTCDTDKMNVAARAAAAAQQIDLSGYDVIVLLFPNLQECSWAGLTGGQAGSPDGATIWLNNAYSVNLFAHELGHAFGAPHASTYRCTENGTEVTLSDTCTTSEYGDLFDVMGCCSTNQMSGWMRAQVGELPLAHQLMVKKSMTVKLTSVDDTSAAGTKLVLLPRLANAQHASQFYALDIRSSNPFNVGLTQTALNGVTVRLVGPFGQWKNSLLLDMHPDSNLGFADAPLADGEAFTDPDAGITIQNVQSADGNATVAITTPDRPDDPDADAPDSVTGLHAKFRSGTVKLVWSDSVRANDPTFDYYEVSRQHKRLVRTTAAAFTDKKWSRSVTARPSYQVVAVDQAGNRSAAKTVRVGLPNLVMRTRSTSRSIKLTLRQQVGPATLPVRLTAQTYRRVCRAHHCRYRATGAAHTRKLTWARSRTLSFPRPRPGKIKFKLTVGSRPAQTKTVVAH